jgi:hypothetical protein
MLSKAMFDLLAIFDARDLGFEPVPAFVKDAFLHAVVNPPLRINPFLRARLSSDDRKGEERWKKACHGQRAYNQC